MFFLKGVVSVWVDREGTNIIIYEVIINYVEGREGGREGRKEAGKMPAAVTLTARQQNKQPAPNIYPNEH